MMELMEGVGSVEVGSALARLAGRAERLGLGQHQTATEDVGQKSREGRKGGQVY